jgi:hypothetical protein
MWTKSEAGPTGTPLSLVQTLGGNFVNAQTIASLGPVRVERHTIDFELLKINRRRLGAVSGRNAHSGI